MDQLRETLENVREEGAEARDALAALVLQEVKASRGVGMGSVSTNAEDEKNWRLKASQIKMQAENEKAAAEKREEKLTAAIKGAQKENEDLKQRLETAKTNAAALERRAAESELEMFEAKAEAAAAKREMDKKTAEAAAQPGEEVGRPGRAGGGGGGGREEGRARSDSEGQVSIEIF